MLEFQESIKAASLRTDPSHYLFLSTKADWDTDAPFICTSTWLLRLGQQNAVGWDRDVWPA